jgi:polar amino acid transport system substrate-binding protein
MRFSKPSSAPLDVPPTERSQYHHLMRVKTVRKSSLFVAIAFFAAIQSGLVQAESITLYGNSEQPPKAWLDDGKPRGFAVEASIEVLRRAGYDVTVELLPFARAMEAAKTGGVMTGVFYSAERAKLYDYSDPFVYDDVVAVVVKGKEFPFEKATDLIGKKVGMQATFFYGDDFAAALPLLTTDTDTSPALRLKKLAVGRTDVALVNPGRAAFLNSAREADLPPDQFTVLPKPLAKLSNHLIVGKGVPGGATLIERLNKAIAAASSDGTIAKIVAKYEN